MLIDADVYGSAQTYLERGAVDPRDRAYLTRMVPMLAEVVSKLPNPEAIAYYTVVLGLGRMLLST